MGEVEEQGWGMGEVEEQGWGVGAGGNRSERGGWRK